MRPFKTECVVFVMNKKYPTQVYVLNTWPIAGGERIGGGD